MEYVLGIDVGTTSTKSVLYDLRGGVVAAAARAYPTYQPRNGWAEQNPQDWWDAVCRTVKQVLAAAQVCPGDILGAGVTGQFQSLVMLDGAGQVLRPAILWSDQRSAPQIRRIRELAGEDELLRITANASIMGNTAAMLLWVRENQPELYRRIRHVLLPNDYIRWRLSGELATDLTNGSSMQLLDVPQRRWSDELLRRLDISATLLSPVHESTEIVGRVTPEGARRSGLLEGMPLVACAGDTVAATVGAGAVEEGVAYTALGTSGMLCANSASVRVDPTGSVNTYCSAVPGMWTLITCLPAAGLSLKWLSRVCFMQEQQDVAKEASLFARMGALAAEVPLGAQALLYLPYLSGARTPYLDPDARGCFVGLNDIHGQGHLVRAVMEGVAFGMRSCKDALESLGVDGREMVLCGGGAKSPLWRQIIASVYGMDITPLREEGGAVLGAAALAAVGAGAWPSVQEAAAQMVHKGDPILFDPAEHARYTPYYSLFSNLYPQLKETFIRLQAL